MRMWPDAPADTVMSVGARGNNSVIIPSLNVALICAEGAWGDGKSGDRASKLNQNLRRLAKACGYKPEAARASGERLQFYPLTLTFLGPDASETSDPNPFTDYRMTVTFSRGERSIAVPGFYSADGNAAQSGGDAGGIWRAHFLPDEAGTWQWRASFRTGPGVAIAEEEGAGQPTAFDGETGSVVIEQGEEAKQGFLGKGILRHAGGRYPRFSGSNKAFIKGGADSPENLLAFADFDATVPSHRYEPHAGDWRMGDPTWRDGKGKNLIGALNYLAGKGMNSVYFLTMNVQGDGKDVWPWTSDKERRRFDCSKLDQWELVFSHMDRLGLMLHVVLQEQENDQLLDKGELGPERRLYLRELIARFAHHPALVWNLGEENTNTTGQLRAFAAYIRDLDPYDHPVVVHTFPEQYDEVYTPLLNNPHIEGASLQLGNMEGTYEETSKWVRRSAEAGRPWLVYLDEIGPANTGVKPDADDPEHDDVRRHALWGNLMAGGAGVEWLFGYKFAHNDINCEDWRSRDRMWDQTRHALALFQQHLPFEDMQPDSEAVRQEGLWCLSKPQEVYAVYAPRGEDLEVKVPKGRYRLYWYNPREGGELEAGRTLRGGDWQKLGRAPSQPDRDWVALIRRTAEEDTR